MEDRIQSLGAVDYIVDEDGWVVQRGNDTFVYSTRGELLSATAGGVTVTYAYDGFGRRMARTEGAATHQYLYGNPEDSFLVTAVRAPDGTLSELFYDESGHLYAVRQDTTWYFVATDPVGSPRVVSDASGTVVKSVTYDAFGNVLEDSAPGFDVPVGFAGGLADPLTGLVRFGMRDYDPASGRWTSRDPLLADSGEGNFYVYAMNDPVTRRDPSGLFCVTAYGYAGVGGGGRVCITRDGISNCRMLGFGIGSGLDIDPLGNLDPDLNYIEAEAKLRIGPVELGYGGKFSECGPSGGPKCNFGPFNLCDSQSTYSHDAQHGERMRDMARRFFGVGGSARVSANFCNNLHW